MVFSVTCADLMNFLKNAGGELQKCFNNEFGFSNAQQVVQDQKRAMTHEVNVLRQKVHSLFTAEGKLYVSVHTGRNMCPLPLSLSKHLLCVPHSPYTWTIIIVLATYVSFSA